jgi:hypothetical protein
MRNLIFSVFAVGVAAVAAMTATTAMLNAPRRAVPAAITDTTARLEQERSALAPDTKPATAENAPPAKPGATPESGKPASGATAAGKPGTGKDTDKDDEGDKDPYQGIAPEELPPDLQYSADSSVSFPTNI